MFKIIFTADCEGNWCSQCASALYGNRCYPEIIEIQEEDNDE